MGNKKQERRICQHCGSKRNINQLQPVAEVPGRYFQAGKEVTLYVCRRERRKATGYEFLYCNGENEVPEIRTWRPRWS